MRKEQDQIILHIREVWSVSSLVIYRLYSIQRFSKRAAKTPIIRWALDIITDMRWKQNK